MRVLYVSYDGMTDNLGQSQVLPYLIGLSAKGHRFVLISFEKKERFEEGKSTIEQICKKHEIDWIPLSYTKFPPILSTLWDVFKMNRKIDVLHAKDPFNLVHCRSHISAIGGSRLNAKFGIPFIFDMRGFYADERVDGKIWNLKNPIFKMVYNYFKRKEKQFLNTSVYNISLTQAGADIIRKWEGFETIPIRVIPCCADLDFFRADRVKIEKLNFWKKKLDFKDSDFIISYLGSIGTWYMAGEMMDFFNRLLIVYPNAKFLFITPESKELILKIATKQGVNPEYIRVIRAKRDEVPELLMLSKISLFFIKPLFSKKSSSPVKMGEILSMGIPVISNRGVGDVDSIIEKSECGILVDDFTPQAYDKAIVEIETAIQNNKNTFIHAADTFYSLEKGVDLYDEVYKNV